MTHTNRKPTTLAILAACALIGAGCGEKAGGEGANGAASGSADSGKAVEFSQCMRDNGVTEFPDPDASGELTIDGVLNGSSLDPNTPTWRAAIEACRDLQPPGFTGDENITAEEQDVRLEFAQCIREQGVEDFPDPAEGAPLIDTNRIPSAATESGMAALNAAMDACGDIAREVIGE